MATFVNVAWAGERRLRHPSKTVACPKQKQTTYTVGTPTKFKRVSMQSSQSSSSPPSSSSPSATVDQLKDELLERLEGYNFGFDFDSDAEVPDADESAIEDIIEQIEDTNEDEVSTSDPRLNGTWDLVYTSSTITRYFGGLSGIHSYLPQGTVEKIQQEISLEDATCAMSEIIRFDVPFSEREAELNVSITGKLRLQGDVRMIWNAENVKVGFFKWFADGWKSLRALTIVDLTYVNESVRIVRGQTGTVTVFIKSANQS